MIDRSAFGALVAAVLLAGLLPACRPDTVALTPVEELERRADIAYAAQDAEAAIETYQQALLAGAQTVKIHNNLANALFREERYNAAEQSYLKALELDPEYLFSLNNLALALFHAGETEEAYDLIGKAKKSFPMISFLHTTYGYFKHSQGDRRAAQRAFEKAIEINPDSPAALNNLGVIFMEDPGLGKDPLPYLNRAVDKDKSNHLFLDSLGWYHYQKGMFADATIEIGKAFAYDPGNLEVRIHYATVLEWIGKDQEALAQWEKILELTDETRIRNLAISHMWEIRGRGAGEEGSG